jgi:hypothetical protein
MGTAAGLLHITNGDAAASVIQAAGIGGDVLPWRDVLHEGPVPAGLSLDALSRVRADFIAGEGWGEPEATRQAFFERDAALREYEAYDEVVLWFEHDLYDQLQLIQLLDFFASQQPGRTRVSLLCNSEYLGNSTPARLAERFPQRTVVSDEQRAAGAAGWAAFRAADPSGLQPLADGAASPLPFLPAALRRHLEQFPSLRNGLSRSEQQALEALSAAPRTLRDAYAAAHHQREEAVWLGDRTFADYVLGMAAEPTPLVELDGAAEADFEHTLARTARLTEAGREVMEARADRVRLNGIDRWLGGVHLQGAGAAWRWDTLAGRLVAGGTQPSA